MKAKLVAILAILVIVLWPPLQSQSQQSTQPVKYFGYFYTLSDSDLSRVRSYTNFTYIDGEYGQSSIDTLVRLRNNGHRAIIDLGKVLWCPQDPANPFGAWHLCTNSEVNYIDRWNNWKWVHRDVLTGDYVLAFSVITEPALRSISTADVETAVALVKQAFPQIPTLVAEASISVNQSYVVPSNVDWVGIAAYYIHPNLDDAFKESVRLLKLKKQWWQKTAYTLDAFYGSSQVPVAPTVADMDTIAQEWYTFASRDPEAIVLAAFIWPDLTGENAIGTISFPQNVLDKHAAIGAAILAGRAPSYQGYFDWINCQSLVGWAWDASQPNTPISVDIYDGAVRIATVRANQFRQDLLNAGIGNGWHGFSFNLPAHMRDGQTHSIAIKYGGLDQQLNVSPKSITCTPAASYYEIVARHSGKCLDVEGESTASGARVIQFSCGGWANQQFHVVSVGGGYYKIVARHSGKVLDVQWGALDNGTPVWQWDENGTAAQQWAIIDAGLGDGYVRIMARHSGKALDVAGGSTADLTQIHQWDYVGIANQQWLLRPVGF